MPGLRFPTTGTPGPASSPARIVRADVPDIFRGRVQPRCSPPVRLCAGGGDARADAVAAPPATDPKAPHDLSESASREPRPFPPHHPQPPHRRRRSPRHVLPVRRHRLAVRRRRHRPTGPDHHPRTHHHGTHHPRTHHHGTPHHAPGRHLDGPRTPRKRNHDHPSSRTRGGTHAADRDRTRTRHHGPRRHAAR